MHNSEQARWGGLARRLRAAAGLAVTVLTALMFVSAAQAVSSHSCGSLPLNYRPTPAEHYTRMFLTAHGSLSCAAATKAMRRYENAATQGTDGARCVGQSVSCQYRDGWTCYAMTPGQWPDIQECDRKGVKVIGWVKSKIKGPR